MLFPFVSLIIWLLVPGSSLANRSPNCSSDALKSPVRGSDGALYATSCEFQLAKQQHPLIEKANLTIFIQQRKSRERPWSRKLLQVGWNPLHELANNKNEKQSPIHKNVSKTSNRRSLLGKFFHHLLFWIPSLIPDKLKGGRNPKQPTPNPRKRPKWPIGIGPMWPGFPKKNRIGLFSAE